MNTTETEDRAAKPSRWHEWLEYVNAVCAISSWGLYGPRAWPIDVEAAELLSRVMSRRRRPAAAPDQAAPAAASTATLAGCCCGGCIPRCA